MPQPQLPTELLRAIIAEVASSADLAACCLAGKSMLPLAREELYRVVSVLILNAREDKEDERPLMRPERLSATIAGNPHIAAVVKRLEIVEECWPPVQAVRSTVEALVTACGRLEQFKWISDDKEEAGWLERMLKKRGGTLLSLEAKCDYMWSPVPFYDMLRHLPHLRHLSLGQPPPERDNNPVLIPAYQLQTLKLDNTISPTLLRLLLGASQDSLETLRFGGVKPSTVYDFSSFHALHIVELTLNLSLLDVADLAHLFQTLGSMPSLRTLNIPATYDEDGYHVGAQGLEAIDVLRLLPPSIVRIHLYTGLLLSTRYLLDFLRNRTRLPVLQHLDVAYDDPEAARFVARSPEVIDAIMAAAQARGVLLSWR